MFRPGLQAASARASLSFQTARTSRTRLAPRFPSQRPLSSSAVKPRASPGTGFTFSSHPRPSPQTLFQRLQNSIRHVSNSRRRLNGKPGGPAAAKEPEPQTLGARMKRLSREYGWTAVGVYAALSALDFPFCYALVSVLGTDRIGRWEDVIVSHVKAIIPESVKQAWHDWRSAMKKSEKEITGENTISDGAEMAGWGVEEAEERNNSHASLGTHLALAYAIHKSFIFVRIPLTAAILPKVVKILRGWGWEIGKRTTKEAKAIKRAALPPKSKRKWGAKK